MSPELLSTGKTADRATLSAPSRSYKHSPSFDNSKDASVMRQNSSLLSVLDVGKINVIFEWPTAIYRFGELVDVARESPKSSLIKFEPYSCCPQSPNQYCHQNSIAVISITISYKIEIRVGTMAFFRNKNVRAISHQASPWQVDSFEVHLCIMAPWQNMKCIIDDPACHIYYREVFAYTSLPSFGAWDRCPTVIYGLKEACFDDM